MKSESPQDNWQTEILIAFRNQLGCTAQRLQAANRTANIGAILIQSTAEHDDVRRKLILGVRIDEGQIERKGDLIHDVVEGRFPTASRRHSDQKTKQQDGPFHLPIL